MLPSRSSNESSFVDLVSSLSNSLNSTTSSSKGNNNFIELNENDFRAHLSSEQQGCFQTSDARALGSVESSQICSNRSRSDAVFDRTDSNAFVNHSELTKRTGALHNEHFKLIDLGDDKDEKLNSEQTNFDRFDCFFESERPQRPASDSPPTVQSTGKSQNLILPGRTLDYWPAGRSDSSPESSSSNLTDENSNECDSFLKSANPQAKYFNRIKKMSYKIKGVLLPVRFSKTLQLFLLENNAAFALLQFKPKLKR